MREAQTLERLARVYRMQARLPDAIQAASRAMTIVYERRHPAIGSVATLLGDL